MIRVIRVKDWRLINKVPKYPKTNDQTIVYVVRGGEIVFGKRKIGEVECIQVFKAEIGRKFFYPEVKKSADIGPVAGDGCILWRELSH